MAGSSTADRATFYFDLASPECWLLAERINHSLPAIPEWTPVCVDLQPPDRDEVERRARELGLLAVKWPPTVPPDGRFAALVATFAKQAGRAVAYSLAAFRQTWAGGRDLGDPDTALLAAAAAELHPTAVLKAVERAALSEALDAAGADLERVPALRTAGGELVYGEAAILG
jgi:2-hydroxychromene-2-carboxylate isomerase